MTEQRYQQRRDQSFETYVVILQDASGSPPTEAYCQGVRNQYGLTMPVLMDPDGLLFPALGLSGGVNDWNVLLSKGATIELKSKYANQAQIDAKIDALLP